LFKENLILKSQVNYDDTSKVSYVTVWTCQTGVSRKRLRNQSGVCAIAISDDGRRIVFGKQPTDIEQEQCGVVCIWDLGNRTTNSCSNLRELRNHPRLSFGLDSGIQLTRDSSQAIVQGTRDVSVWDVDNGVLLSVFTPDARVQSYTLAYGDQIILFGLSDCSNLVSLTLNSRDIPDIELLGENMFEEESSSDEEADEEEKEDNELDD